LDEVLEMLDKTAKRLQKVVDESKESSSKQTYTNILKSSEVSPEQKMKAFINRKLEIERLDRLSSQLSLIYMLQIFAFKVKVLDVSVDNINEQLVNSGMLQKSAELEDIKKNIDSLKILLDAHYESMKELREGQTENLSYIH
jgi:hypothetical protein